MDSAARLRYPAAAMNSPQPGGQPRYRGEVVYIFAYDIAYELRRITTPTLLGQPLAEFVVETGKRHPRTAVFERPQTVRLPPVERVGPQGVIRLEQVVKLLPVGGISITVRVPFAVDHVEDLVEYHDLEFNHGTLAAAVRELAEQVRQEVAPFCVRPVRELAEEEAYTVFCLAAPLPDAPSSAEEWLYEHSRVVAALLTQETDVAQLSLQEAAESTDRHLSYYDQDLVVVDWDAALVVDAPRHFEEIVYVMELANLQLTELEAYDRLLDEALERAYRDLSSRGVRGRTAILRELRELRIDLTRLSDELLNISKFFGDWHLARIYENVAARFHLSDWHRTVDEKLKSLDSLYQLLQHENINRWMLVLEATIVLLFVIDLAVLLGGMSH